MGGRRVIEWSVDAFERNAGIDGIVVVMNERYISDMEEIARERQWSKVMGIVAGGTERYMSTLSALSALRGEGECNVILHDAARPLVSQRIIDDVVAALMKYDAVGVAVAMTDTVFEVDADGCVAGVMDRSRLRRAQTPHAFRKSVLEEAYKRLAESGAESLNVTDDCGTVARYMPEVRVCTVEGEVRNMKLTYKEDLEMLENFVLNC